MDQANHARAFTKLLVGSLAELGLRHACVSPGSRSSQLALALAENSRIRDWSHHDERSAAFFALGVAKATGRPSALACTSGTAAAHYYPAVIEARQARVPLIVLTADRPPELRGVGAPQAIDQLKLYGDAVKWFHEAGIADEVAVANAPALALRAWSAAVEDPPGPVHINLPFREPLVGQDHVDVPPVPKLVHQPGELTPGEAALAPLTEAVSGKQTLVVCGSAASPGEAAAIAQLSSRARLVVFADPQSGLRTGSNDAGVIPSADLLAGAGMLDRLSPDVVLRIGGVPTSRSVWEWLRVNPQVPQIYLDASGWREPLGSASHIVRAQPEAACRLLGEHVAPAPADWREAWQRADAAAQGAVDETLATEGFPSEPAIARALASMVPPGAVVYAGSSMPIRDLDSYAPRRDTAVAYLGNRGANGIDGLLSSATGVAAALNRPTYTLAGDLSVLHDLSALAFAARTAPPVTFVVVNNDGGGIFHFLPQADPEVVAPDVFERHFAAPHGIELVPVAAAFGIDAIRCDDPDAFDSQVKESRQHPRLIELHTDRDENVKVHRRIREGVAAAVDAVL